MGPREAHKLDAPVRPRRDGDRASVNVLVSPGGQDLVYVGAGELAFVGSSVSRPEVHAIARLVDCLDLVSRINWDGLHPPDDAGSVFIATRAPGLRERARGHGL